MLCRIWCRKLFDWWCYRQAEGIYLREHVERLEAEVFAEQELKQIEENIQKPTGNPIDFGETDPQKKA